MRKTPVELPEEFDLEFGIHLIYDDRDGSVYRVADKEDPRNALRKIARQVAPQGTLNPEDPDPDKALFARWFIDDALLDTAEHAKGTRLTPELKMAAMGVQARREVEGVRNPWAQDEAVESFLIRYGPLWTVDFAMGEKNLMWMARELVRHWDHDADLGIDLEPEEADLRAKVRKEWEEDGNLTLSGMRRSYKEARTDRAVRDAFKDAIQKINSMPGVKITGTESMDADEAPKIGPDGLIMDGEFAGKRATEVAPGIYAVDVTEDVFGQNGPRGGMIQMSGPELIKLLETPGGLEQIIGAARKNGEILNKQRAEASEDEDKPVARPIGGL